MTASDSGVRRVLRAFEDGEWDEIHLVTADVELHLTSRGSEPASVPSAVPGGYEAAAVPAPVPAPVAVPAAVPVAADAGLTTVSTPSPGIFWRSPSPGAPPFADVGATVSSGTALCIVEVMKLMNTIPAPVTGTIVEVCVQNGESVQSGDPLFRIRPEGG